MYGITQGSETSNYMFVLRKVHYGSLRSNLLIKKYNPNDKYVNLHCVTKSLSALHKCNLVHGDFHSGNLLLWNQKRMYISDLRLSKPAEENHIQKLLIYILLVS